MTRLPELLAAPLLPLLIVQGRRARRTIPRLPEAEGPDTGVANPQLEGAPLSLVGIGESPVAGVGVARLQDAVTAQLALALSARTGRPVRWLSRGANGITAGQAQQTLIPALPSEQADLALVAFGVNDTTAFHSAARWQADLSALLDALDRKCSPRRILLSGVPPMALMRALPQPLRAVLGAKARELDLCARRLAESRPHVVHVPLTLDPRQPDLMASDGYHPSAAGSAQWARALAAAVEHSF